MAPRPASEHGVEGGQEDDEEGGLLASRQGAQLVDEIAILAHVDMTASQGLQGRSWPVGRQLQEGWKACHLLFPVGQLGGIDFPFLPLTLPDRVVDVLDRQRRQGWCAVQGQRPIEAHEFAIQHRQRPTIGCDVMHRQEHRVGNLIVTHQSRAQRSASGQIERLLNMAPGEEPLHR